MDEHVRLETAEKYRARAESAEARLAEMTREARLSREATEKAVRREERLRDRIAYLHDVYAVSPNEPRCCSDCAANDVSPELRKALADTADIEPIPPARLHESNPRKWCSCGHPRYEHSAPNVVGCYYCECDVDV